MSASELLEDASRVVPLSGGSELAERLAIDVGDEDITLQQVMLRFRADAAAEAFFRDHLRMSVIHRCEFSQWKFRLSFMASLTAEEEAAAPEPGSPEAHRYLWTFPRTALEMTENFGTADDPESKYASGNEEPHRGFGHIGFTVADLEGTVASMLAAGIKFKKLPSEGSMRNIAFAIEPTTGYWIELIQRPPPRAGEADPFEGRPSFQQAMVRVKDPAVTRAFYETHFRMTTVCIKHFPAMKFSLYFMGTFPRGTTLPADPESEAAWDFALRTRHTLVEFTHNHGTESDPDFKGYCAGNDGASGYGHIGVLVNGLVPFCEAIEAAGVRMRKRPHEGAMRGLAFALDPDGYSVEIIERGLPSTA